MEIVFWIIMRKMILCDIDQITIPQIKVILSRKNWSHLTLPTSYPKYLLILALMNENCPSFEGQFIFRLEINNRDYHQEENGFLAKLEFKYL